MAETITKGKKDKNKKILIGVGIVIVGVALWLIMRKKKTSSVFLNINNYPASKYAPLTDAQVKTELDKANALVASKGVDGAIADLQSQIASLQAQGTPESLALASLLQDFIADLETQKANEIRSTTTASIGTTDTTSTGTMSIADNAMVNDGTNITLGSNTTTNPTTANGGIDAMLGGTKSTITPSPLSTPQPIQLTTATFNAETYNPVPQATIDSRLGQVNASILSNGVPATVASLLAESNTLANSTSATDKGIAQLLYDMAVTIDVANNPANASKYAVVKDANYWRNWLNNQPATFDLARWIYIKWATRGLKLTEPTESQYAPLRYGSAKTTFLKNLITLNGREALVSNIIFNLTPSGNLIANRTPSIRDYTNWQTT